MQKAQHCLFIPLKKTSCIMYVYIHIQCINMTNTTLSQTCHPFFNARTCGRSMISQDLRPRSPWLRLVSGLPRNERPKGARNEHRDLPKYLARGFLVRLASTCVFLCGSGCVVDCSLVNNNFHIVNKCFSVWNNFKMSQQSTMRSWGSLEKSHVFKCCWWSCVLLIFPRCN